MELKRVPIGQEINEWPSRSWDRICTHVEAGEQAIHGQPSVSPALRRNALMVRVKWVGSGTAPRGGCVVMTTPANVPSSSDDNATMAPIVMNVDYPAADSPRAKLAVPVWDLTGTGVGWAAFGGLSWARVNVTDAGHGFAKPIDNISAKMESSELETDFPILWKDTGTGDMWAMVLLIAGTGAVSNVVRAKGTLAGNMCPGDTVPALATFSVKGSTATYTPSSVNLTNPQNFIGRTGDYVEMDFNRDTLEAEITGVIYRHEQFDQVNYEDTNHKIVRKRFTIATHFCGAGTDSDLLTFEQRSIVTGVNDGTTVITFPIENVWIVDPTETTDVTFDATLCGS